MEIPIIAPYVQKDPTKFCTYEEFEKGVSALETFVKLRSQSVRNQLNGNNNPVNTTNLNTSDMGTMGGMGGRQNQRMPEMPIGQMDATPPDGFTPPRMFVAEIPNETPAPDSNPQTEQQEAAANNVFAPSTDKSANETQSARGNRTSFTGRTAFSNAPGANTGAQADVSSETLLIISVCVLLASIAIAFFIKH